MMTSRRRSSVMEPGSYDPTRLANEMDDDDDEEEEATVLLHAAATTSTDATHPHDTADSSIIFGYLALPHVILGATDAVWDIITYLLGYELDYNTLEYVTGVVDVPDVDRSPASLQSLNLHALVGSVGILLLGFQVVSGTWVTRHHHHPTRLAKRAVHPATPAPWHRRLGPLAALVWIVANLSGVYYLFASQRIVDKQVDWKASERWIHRFYHCLVGTAGLTNLGNGLRALGRGDCVLHRGSMYFAFYWGNFVNVFKFIRSLVQYRRGVGDMDIRLYTLIAAVTLTMETPLYAALGYRFGGQAYRRPFVTYNLICFGVIIGSGWVALLCLGLR